MTHITACTILSVIVVHIVRRALSDSLASGAIYALVDDERHMFRARGPATTPWTPQLAQDFVVLQYDRKDGAIVGYQKSTGKVFAQRKAGTPNERHNLELDHAVLLSLEKRTAFELDRYRPCAVLTLAPHVEDSDVEWRSFEDMDEIRRRQSWTITSETNTGKRTVHISSNRDSLLHCKCVWEDTHTIWHAIAGTARSNGCSPHNIKAIGDSAGIDAHEVPFAMLEISLKKRARFCRELSAKLAHRVLLPVSASALDSHRAALLNEEQCWLKGVAENGKHRVSQSVAAGLDTVRSPRSTVLMDIKYTVKTIEVVQTMLAIVSKNTQIIVGQSLVVLASKFRHNTSRLYDIPTLDSARQREIKIIQNEFLKLIEIKLEDPMGLMPISIPLSCDGTAATDLYQLLTGQSASMTPESANTSVVGIQFGRYVAEIAKCTAAQLRALSNFAECFASVHSSNAGNFAMPSSQTGKEDVSIAAMMGASTMPADIESAISQLDNVLSEKYRRTALNMRQQLIDISDKVVQTAINVGDAQVQTARHLMQTFSSAMHNWQSRIDVLKRLDRFQNSSDVVPWFDLIADTWCCAVAQPMPLINGTRPCIRYLERVVQRTRF
jgi:hypothetical protein